MTNLVDLTYKTLEDLKVLYEAGLLSEETYKSMVEELVQSVN